MFQTKTRNRLKQFVCGSQVVLLIMKIIVDLSGSRYSVVQTWCNVIKRKTQELND